MIEELTQERIKDIETRWKSDVDFKLDRLVAFANAYEPFLVEATQTLKERSAIRRAVIEKSLVGLIWAGLAFLATATWNYVKDHLR